MGDVCRCMGYSMCTFQAVVYLHLVWIQYLAKLPYETYTPLSPLDSGGKMSSQVVNMEALGNEIVWSGVPAADEPTDLPTVMNALVDDAQSWIHTCLKACDGCSRIVVLMRRPQNEVVEDLQNCKVYLPSQHGIA